MTVPEQPRARFAPSDLFAGLLSALVTLSYASSFATLIFGGLLASQANLALLAALVSGAVATLVLSWRSSFHFTVGGPDSNPSAILAVTVAAISADLLREGAGTEVLPTVLMFLFVSALGCGLLLYLVGERHWGRYVRFIPYQVLGGFLVGSGYLLLAGGWKMLFGVNPSGTTLDHLAKVPAIACLFAVAVALTLLVLMRLWKHFLVIPGVILLAVAVFHLVLWRMGLNLDAARLQGLLLQPVHIGAWSNPFNQPWGVVRWDLILTHANDFIAMTMVLVISILLNATSLDHAVGHDADFDRELKAVGLANILGGFAGGMVAGNSFNRSLLNLRAGAQSRWAARAGVGFVALLVVCAPQAVGWLPKPVLTGLILYLGLSLMIQWLWDGRKEMLRGDYLIMLGILATVMLFGIVAGVIAGILASMGSFVLKLSRAAVIKERFTSATRQSNVERSPDDVLRLRNYGDQLQGAVLNGYLFFGTSSTMLDQLRPSLPKAKVLMLDFWHVHGVDASSVIILRKLLKLAAEARVQVVFTGLSAGLQRRLTACGLDPARSSVKLFPDLDRGLEWAEESLLSARSRSTSASELFAGLDPAEVADAAGFFENITVPAGETFIRSGDGADRLYLVLEGRVSIYLHFVALGYRKRMRSYSTGTIVGEMGLYNEEPRSADISADVDTRLASISRARIRELEETHPRLASRLHRLVVLTLATRLRVANGAIQDLSAY